MAYQGHLGARTFPFISGKELVPPPPRGASFALPRGASLPFPCVISRWPGPANADDMQKANDSAASAVKRIGLMKDSGIEGRRTDFKISLWPVLPSHWEVTHRHIMGRSAFAMVARPGCHSYRIQNWGPQLRRF